MTPLVLTALAALAGPPESASDELVGRRLQELLHAHQEEVFACVRAAGAPPSGEALVRVVAGEGGAVARAEILKDESGRPEVGACLVGRVRAWNLSSLGVAPGDQVVFPLAFRPAPGGEPAPPPEVAPSSLRATISALELAAHKKQLVTHDGQLALFVVSGRVKVGGHAAGPDDLVWIAPGKPVELVAESAARLVRVDSTLPVSPPDKPLPPVRVIHAADRPSYRIAGGKGTARLYLSDETHLAVDTLTFDAGVSLPAHTHDDADELLYVVAGRGTTTLGGARVPTGPGQLLRIPAGTAHALTVEQPIRAIQVYAPGGPEQRFKR